MFRPKFLALALVAFVGLIAGVCGEAQAARSFSLRIDRQVGPRFVRAPIVVQRQVIAQPVFAQPVFGFPARVFVPGAAVVAPHCGL